MLGLASFPADSLTNPTTQPSILAINPNTESLGTVVSKSTSGLFQEDKTTSRFLKANSMSTS